ncbi:MAG: FtsX-like permease family protein [bacterium]
MILDRFRRYTLLLLVLLITAGAFANPKIDKDKLQARYKVLASQIDAARMAETVRFLSSFSSRIPGYEGDKKAANYVQQQFVAAGLENVRREMFPVTVPIDNGAGITVNGKEIKLHALWPNLVRTSQLPFIPDFVKNNRACGKVYRAFVKEREFENVFLFIVNDKGTYRLVNQSDKDKTPQPYVLDKVDLDKFVIQSSNAQDVMKSLGNLAVKNRWLEITDGVTGPLLYVGNGKLEEFNGRQVAGSIVIADFNSGNQWLNAPRLGAKAVIFIEPETTMRGEAEAKFISIPISIPRFWISRSDAPRILALATGSAKPVATVKCKMRWQSVEAANIIGSIPAPDQIPDENGKLIKNPYSTQWIVVSGYYDSTSVVPSLAPGAENATGIAAMLELARLWQKEKSYRPILFVASSGHYQALSGIRAYIDKHLPEYESIGIAEKVSNNSLYFYLILGMIAVFIGLNWLVFRTVKKTKEAGSARTIAIVACLILTLLLGTVVSRNLKSGSSRKPTEIYLWATLDLSTQSRIVGLFFKGWFYDYRDDLQNKFSDVARACRENADRIAPVYGLEGKDIFADGVNPTEGRNWRTFIPGKPAFDCEAVTVAGGLGITFATTDDVRGLVDTPFDTYDKVNLPNLTLQVQTLACLFDHILHDPTEQGDPNTLRFPVTEGSGFTRIGLQNGFGKLHGRVLRFDPEKSFVPNTPIEGSLAVLKNPIKSFMGVRGNMISMVYVKQPVPDEKWLKENHKKLNDFKAYYEFSGVPPITAFGYGKATDITAYHVDEITGEIDYAPDQGQGGGADYTLAPTMNSGDRDTSIVVFKCVPTAIYDLVDPQSLKVLSGLTLFEGDTNGTPRRYGVEMGSTGVANTSYVEDVAVIFTEPGARLKIKMSSSLADTRLLLLNSLPPDFPDGVGYLVAGDPRDVPGFQLNRDPKIYKNEGQIAIGGAISHTALYAAKDMWLLDDWRLQKLEKHRIVNTGVSKLHALAKENLDKADIALKELNYSDLDVLSRAAWGYEARAYPDVQATAKDVVNGVIFYLALLMPFAYFMERLLFACRILTKQLSAAGAIFIVTFVALRFIHPAFDITGNPVIVFIAFIMGALSIIVSTFIIGKFEQNLKELNKQTMGVHKADIGRMSVAFAAFSLGVSNMRRRPARTFLTSLTLVLVTFIVLSFTSVVNELRFNEIDAPGVPRYNGLMIRTPVWDKLQESSFRILRDEFKDRAIAPRSWMFGSEGGTQNNVTFRRADRDYSAKAIVGLSPDEARITRPQDAIVGRWFIPSDVYSIIIPRQMAIALKVDEQDIGKARINFSGQEYTVIGIFDSAKLKKILDLDGEPLTPVDFTEMDRMARQGKSESGQQAFKEYVHQDPEVCVYIPYRTSMNLGADIRSISVEFTTPEETQEVMTKLMPRLGLNLYAVTPQANKPPKITRFSTISSTSSRGLEMVIIPIVIAAVIVLNTMIGAVFERVKEISIFSAIGLAPNHIGMLFFAESLVFAILGSVVGYFVAQTAAKILIIYPIAGLYLNFSSTAAVQATVVVVGVVLLSTIYPARKASEVATPAMERGWKLPDPDGDSWRLPLPFSVTSVQAAGLAVFLSEWFAAYEEYSVGDFVTQDVKSSSFDTERGIGYRVNCTSWIAPFDLGVSQEVEIESIPTEMSEVYDIYVNLKRLSGDIANWKRVNRRFLNTLRKQFLIWRTLRNEERERYVVSDPNDATVVPSPSPGSASS